MAVKHNILSIGLSPVHVTNWNILRSESSIIFKNISFGNIYLGASHVSTSNYGFRMLPEQTLSITLGPYDELYAVSDSLCEMSVLLLEN
jgi:hypothetical protein